MPFWMFRSVSDGICGGRSNRAIQSHDKHVAGYPQPAVQCTISETPFPVTLVAAVDSGQNGSHREDDQQS